MNGSPSDDETVDLGPATITQHIDEICDEFESRWLAGQRPRIEEFLPLTTGSQRAALFRELIALQMDYVGQDGQTLCQADFYARFPEFRKTLDELFTPHDSWLAALDSCDDTAALQREDPRPELHAWRTLVSATWPFGELPESVIAKIVRNLTLGQYKPGDVIIQQGHRARELIIVSQGLALVRVRDHEGQTHQVAEVGPAGMLGEIGLLTGEPSTATVEAVSEVQALRLSESDFREIASACPMLEVLLSQLVSLRLGKAEHDVLVGKTIHGYRIRRCVGAGGMAAVYEAETIDTGKRVALKMLLHRLAYSPEALQRFQREAEISRSLRHPHICRTYGCFPAFNTYFIVMTYCDGKTLADLIRGDAELTDDQIRNYLGQLAQALGFLHAKGIVHRDLKPSNVMLTGTGRLKLADFGLARSPQDLALTVAGQSLGTPRYMAPEQLLGGETDIRSDLFSFGCIAYELMVRAPLFHERDLPSLLKRHLRWKVPKRDSIRPGLPPDFYDLLSCCLHRDPARRTVDLQTIATWADV